MSGRKQAGAIAKVAAVSIAVVAIVLVVGTWLMARSAQQATEDAVRSVSMFYLDELAGRREQVVETNLKTSIENIKTAIGLLTDDDLSDMESLQAFQAKMKKLYSLDKFAFVDEDGLIYTSLDTQSNISDYNFDYQNITGPEISEQTLADGDKKVIIAVPLDGVSFLGKTLKVCFMEIDMDEMIEGLSLQTNDDGATFCNMYTSEGNPLTDMVLGGLASEDNLLTALQNATFDEGYSYEGVVSDFENGKSGLASFTYHGIQETLDYEPVPGTDWMVTYLIRESVISDQISGISQSITIRGLIQTLITAFVMFAAAGIMIYQTRRNAQLAMAEEANRAKTAFLSNMSHEIRTPINTIIGLDSIALSDPDVPEKTRVQLAKIGDSATHLLELINDILDVSRIEAGHMTIRNEAFSLSKLVEQVNTIIASQCNEKGLEYRSSIGEDVAGCYLGDDTKLRQVLVNVLGNAVKFTPAGGSVSLSVERTAQHDDRTTLRFTMSDTGIGIDEDFLPRIFETFSQENAGATNRYGSTGLGLAITKSIVEMMGGTIEVESEKGKGTTFFITVTLAQASEEEREACERHEAGIAAQDSTNLAGRRILLAEDTAINAEIVVELMKMRDAEVDHAENGQIAVDMFAASEPGCYSAILMDMRMPVMNGLEATRAIRAIDHADAKTIPIVALTANAFDDDVQKSLEAGLNAHLSKPVEPDRLFETLESLVQE